MTEDPRPKGGGEIHMAKKKKKQSKKGKKKGTSTMMATATTVGAALAGAAVGAAATAMLTDKKTRGKIAHSLETVKDKAIELAPKKMNEKASSKMKAMSKHN